jgi:hypothetical protein
MYHQIILDRLLDSINLVQNIHRFDSQERLLIQMQATARKMLNWLNQITFSNGQIPLLNDAALGIALSTESLNKYAIRLGVSNDFSFEPDKKQGTQNPEQGTINPKPDSVTSSFQERSELKDVNGTNPESKANRKTRNPKLKESGYRRYNGTNYECILDIGPIGPTYQPGHAHADTFNFVLNVNNKPCIIDYGISTYEANKQRLIERSTSAHNTVTIKDQNSSEVWSSFRVARRANISLLNENEEMISARHDGYRKNGSYHHRKWKFSESQLQIDDTIEGKANSGIAHFWLDPELKPSHTDQAIAAGLANFTFKDAESVEIVPTRIPDGYNSFIDSYKIEVEFKDHLETTIQTS